MYAVKQKTEYQWAHWSIAIAYIASQIPSYSTHPRRIHPDDFNPYARDHRPKSDSFGALHSLLAAQQGDVGEGSKPTEEPLQ